MTKTVVDVVIEEAREAAESLGVSTEVALAAAVAEWQERALRAESLVSSGYCQLGLHARH